MPSVVDHSELVAEIPMVEKMSTHDRLKHAKKRRIQQLKRFQQHEKQVDKDIKKKKAKAQYKDRTIKVHFISSVMLLDAAARNDVDEGEKFAIVLYAKSLVRHNRAVTAVH